MPPKYLIAKTPEPEAVQRALRGAPGWITEELIEHTLRIWQPFYDYQLIPEDALEMITNIGQMFEALSTGDHHETVSGARSGEQP